MTVCPTNADTLTEVAFTDSGFNMYYYIKEEC